MHDMHILARLFHFCDVARWPIVVVAVSATASLAPGLAQSETFCTSPALKTMGVPGTSTLLNAQISDADRSDLVEAATLAVRGLLQGATWKTIVVVHPRTSEPLGRLEESLGSTGPPLSDHLMVESEGAREATILGHGIGCHYRVYVKRLLRQGSSVPVIWIPYRIEWWSEAQ